MGEDRVSSFVEKHGDVLASRQRHSSVISSCSEDADSESTSTGFTPTPDEEREEELEYGPGIVNKLKTRFLSITLKQNRGMRRSCSMENLLDQDKSSRNSIFSPDRCNAGKDDTDDQSKIHPWGHLKRAKSMDTLLLELQPEPSLSPITQDINGDTKKEPKIVRRRDGGLLRTVPTICDEELPKPDTVKTYKRMFEPAESRRGSCSRRPPVLRASAKSGSMSVSKVSNSVSSSAKVNGTVLKSKLSAKQESSTPKAQKPDKEIITSNSSSNQPSINGDSPKPVCNGNFVKAVPLKITDSRQCNGKVEKLVEKALTKPNNLSVSKKELHYNGNNCNGSSNPKEFIKIEKMEEYIKPGVKKLVNKVVNGTENPVMNIVNGIKTKPKVPPNRPAFVRNVKYAKIEQNSLEKNNLIPKLKPVTMTPKKGNENTKLETQSRIEKSIPSKLITNGEMEKDSKNFKPTEIKKETKIVAENNLKNMEQFLTDTKTKTKPDSLELPSTESEKVVNEMINGHKSDIEKMSNSPKATVAEPKPEPKPVKKLPPSDPITTSMVFDFRGKDVVPHVAVLPTPFGCKALHPKKRTLLVDGKEMPTENGTTSDDEDEYHMDYSVPLPSGVIFEGENVKIGRGSILSTRNKELKIQFDDNVDDNTFVYPSESSLLEDGEQTSLSPSPPPFQSTPSKLKSNPAIGSSGEGGLSTYTPSVLRTMDNFEPGMFRPPPPAPSEKDDIPSGEEENTEMRKEDTREEDKDMLKPADPGIISSWSLSAGTSDLLF